MLNPFATWSRLLSAAIDLSLAGQRVAETMIASHDVVARRSVLIHDAARAPLSADYAELRRMFPEKVEAFTSAGSAVSDELWALQSSFWEEAQHLTAMAMRGRPPTPIELMDLASRNVTHTVRSVERTVAIGSRAIAPVHARATSNARRLNRTVRVP